MNIEGEEEKRKKYRRRGKRKRKETKMPTPRVPPIIFNLAHRQNTYCTYFCLFSVLIHNGVPCFCPPTITLEKEKKGKVKGK
jgi:hypothetical protein